MSNSLKLHKLLSATTIERQVEDIYNEALKRAFPSIKLEYPFACDGYCEFEVSRRTHRLLIEYKFDEDFSSKATRSRVLAQVLAYMKRLEDNGHPLPTAVLVADKNECFVLHANDLVKWLGFEGVKWDVAPSNMANANPDLVLALAEDDSRNAFVFDVTEDFDFMDVAQKIESLSGGVVKLIRITEHNVDKVFGAFEKKIVLEKKISSNDMVALFFNVVTSSEDTYLHPTKKNVLVWSGREVRVDTGKLKAFMSHFATTCSPKEKARLSSISDRLLEDTSRRRKGAFYTPTAFVDYSHKMITEQLGESWKDDYVVWDCACGTKNLTRDYRFKELYCSTLENAELDISKKLNPEATAFQFDFLNDELKRVSEGGKAPDSLIDALEKNKKIIFYINPPYKIAGYTSNGRDNDGKTSLANRLMNDDKIGRARQEIYAQFLYRIMKIKEQFSLTDANLALFCKPKFLCGEAFKKFRERFLKTFKFESGIFFNAGHFAGVSAAWGITFNIWTSGETVDKISFIHDVVDLDENGDIVKMHKKWLYNVDNSRRLLDIFGKQKRTAEVVNFKYPSPFSASETNVKFTEDGIGSIYITGLSPFGMTTLAYWHGHDIVITPDNIGSCAIAFSSRWLAPRDWEHDKDEFMVPDMNHQKYQEFVNDSIVYMCIGGGYDFSLRNISYHNKKWDVKNEFFWMSRSELESLAEEHSIDELYQDAHTSDERFVCKKLQSMTLNPEAQAVVDKVSELVRKSMKFRKMFNDEHPETQILNWDAGWYQLKQMLKQCMPDELKAFRELQKKLADKMRPMVYELGFLRK